MLAGSDPYVLKFVTQKTVKIHSSFDNQTDITDIMCALDSLRCSFKLEIFVPVYKQRIVDILAGEVQNKCASYKLLGRD